MDRPSVMRTLLKAQDFLYSARPFAALEIRELTRSHQPWSIFPRSGHLDHSRARVGPLSPLITLFRSGLGSPTGRSGGESQRSGRTGAARQPPPRSADGTSRANSNLRGLPRETPARLRWGYKKVSHPENLRRRARCLSPKLVASKLK